MSNPDSRRQAEPEDDAPLLPCPFCASTDVGYYEYVFAKMYAVSCRLCGAEGPRRVTQADARQLWNRRVKA